MYDNNENKYLRKLGVFHCRITKVGTKPAKGKFEEKFSITFESAGQLIDQDYAMSKLKPTDTSRGGEWARKQLKEIMAICGVSKPSELVGKEIAVLVAPGFWEGKGPYWNPKSFYDVKWLLGDKAQLDAALNGMDDLFGEAKTPDPIDKLPF